MIKLLLLCSLVQSQTSWPTVVDRATKVGVFAPESKSQAIDAHYVVVKSHRSRGYSTQHQIFVWGTLEGNLFVPESVTVVYKSVLEGVNHNVYSDLWVFVSDVRGHILQVERQTITTNPEGRILDAITTSESPTSTVVVEEWETMLEFWDTNLPR